MTRRAALRRLLFGAASAPAAALPAVLPPLPSLRCDRPVWTAYGLRYCESAPHHPDPCQ